MCIFAIDVAIVGNLQVAKTSSDLRNDISIVEGAENGTLNNLEHSTALTS